MKKFFFLIILFFSCLEKPKLPEWDVEITIPLIEKSFTIFSFLDSHYFVFNSDSTFNFFYQTNFDTIFPIEKFNLNIDRFNSSYCFNNFEIYDTFYSEIIIDAEEILGIAISDSFILLPPLNQQRELEKIININNFNNGFIEKFLVILEIENSLPLNFRHFEVKLDNFSFSLEILEPNSQKETAGVFNNIFLSSPVRVFLNYEIFANDSVLVRKRDYLKLILKFTNIKLIEGELKLKKVYFNDIYKWCLNSINNVDLNYGEIKEGYLDLDIINQFPFPLLVFLKIKEINYNNSFDIPAFADQRISISLEGKSISQNLLDKKAILFSIEINAQITDTENFFSIKKENHLSFCGQIKDLKFKKIEGVFLSPFYFLKGEDSLIIDFLGNPKGIKFEKAEMFLDFVYNLRMPIKILFNGKSINRNQEICSLYKEICLPPRNGQSLNRISEKIDITDLINNGPKILKFNYSGEISGRAIMEDKEFILSNASIDIPLKFSFSKDTFVAYENNIFLEEEEREKVKNLVGGELVCEVINHFPIGFDGLLIIKSEGDSVFFPFKLASGIISEKGYCEKEREDKIILEMSENQLEIFKREKLKILLKIYLPESDTLILRPKDFLSFKSYVTLKVKTGEIVRAIRK